MEKIKISIIIPCYNSFDLMTNCLASLENQTQKNFEVIFIDDCSKDKTLKSLISYKEKSNLNIKILRNNKNRGPGASRNLGIKNAQSEYIVFCDSDDWFELNFIEEIYKELNKNAPDIIIFDYNKIIKGKKIKANSLSELSNGLLNESYIIATKYSLCCFCIRKSIFIDIKIPNLYNGEDIAIIPLLIYKAHKISILKNSFYNYYFRANSTSNKSSKKVAEQLITAFNYIESNLENKIKQEILEYLGIKIILYGVTLNLFKLQDMIMVRNVINNFERKYTSWYKNEYIKKLGILKRIYLLVLRKRLLVLNLLFSKIHSKLVEN